MSAKSKGMCPFCNEQIEPIVIEENTIRRDKCQCPECSGIIYVCRSPGCNNYAKGGIWDDELCPACTTEVSSMVKGLVLPAALGVVFSAFSKKD